MRALFLAGQLRVTVCIRDTQTEQPSLSISCKSQPSQNNPMFTSVIINFKRLTEEYWKLQQLSCSTWDSLLSTSSIERLKCHIVISYIICYVCAHDVYPHVYTHTYICTHL